MAKKKVSRQSKKKKTSVQIMEETFVMVSLSFVFGTMFAAGFLWFVINQLTIEKDYEENSSNTEAEINLEKDHIDTTNVTENDYNLIDYAKKLESKTLEYCSGSTLDTESDVIPICPDTLDSLIPDFIASAEEVGGDLSVFKYYSSETEFEINVKLSDDASGYMETDGGNSDYMYEVGTDLSLLK